MDISWERARSMFGKPQPPGKVWERQFDHFNDELHRLCRTPWREIDFSDLWFYYHDLAYVELQPEVFAYLFPVCLMAWHDSLMKNASCGVGDAEFHYSVHHGNVFERMMTPAQHGAVADFFKDSFLTRLDQERGFIYAGSKTPAYGWMCRFNSIGLITPRIDTVWDAWWACGTPGRAVAAIEYLSGLIYPLGKNPLFPAWDPVNGGGDPPLLNDDSRIIDSGWMDENTSFLRVALTRESLDERLQRAIASLRNEPEYPVAAKLEDALRNYRDIADARVKELPSLLSTLHLENGWSE